MAAPFDDQAIIDLPQPLTYVDLVGNSSSWAVATLDDESMTTVFSGTLSLVARDVSITVSRTAVTSRPLPGATVTELTDDGATYTIVSSLYRKLGYFWEITARTYDTNNGLTETGDLSRRNSSANTPEGLNDPTWTTYASAERCRLLPDEQTVDASGETAVDTILTGRVIYEGLRTMRAGDRFTDEDGVHWNVDSVEPYDTSLAATVFRVSRRL